MSIVDKNIGGSLSLDLTKWRRHMEAKNSQIALFFALIRILFSANENKTVKQNNQSHDAITSR